MPTLRNHCIGAVLLLGAAGCGTIDSAIGTHLGASIGRSTPAPRDHYDPAYLNEAAVAAWSKGERGTTLLLLERAAVIAPQDRRILNNLETVRRAGNRSVLMHYGPLPEPAGMVQPKAAATDPATPGAVLPATPEPGIWPLE